MATIKYYLHPGAAAEIETADSVAASLLSRWPSGAGVPQGLRVYRGSVASRACDVTENMHELLAASDETYTVTVEPGDLTTALVIISIVISVSSILLAPSVSGAPANANRNQQSPNNSFGNRTNEPRVNQRSADVRGMQPRAYADLLQVPYRVWRDGIEYEYVYGQWSEGFIDVDLIRDGDTLFNRISGARLAVYGPGTSPLSGAPQLVIGSAPTEPLRTVTQSNEVSGETLGPPNEQGATPSQFVVYSDGRIEQAGTSTIDFSQFIGIGTDLTLTDFWVFEEVLDFGGYIQRSLNGTYEVIGVGEDFVQVDTNGVAAWNVLLFSPQTTPFIMYQTSTFPSRFYYEISEIPPEEHFFEVRYDPSISSIASPQSSVAVNISGSDRVLVNIVAQNGLYKDDGTTLTSVTISVRLTEYELDNDGLRTGETNTQSATVSSNPNNIRNSTGITIEYVSQYTNSEVSMERISATDTTFAGTVVDEIKWRDLYLVNDVTSVDTSYATTVHAEIKATTDALRVKERKLNARVTRLVETYSDGTFSGTEDTASDMFADVVASIWRDPLFGRGEDDEVDWENLYDVQDQLVAYFGGVDVCRVGYTFDSDKITAEQAIKLICNAVNVEPYRIGNVMYFWPELPQSQSSMQFGHRFKHPGTDQIDRLYGPEDDHTGVELTYFDEITESFEVLTRGSDVNPLRIELSGCITARGAQVRVDREWNKLRYSRVRQSFDATALARMVTKGMRIDAVDNTRYEPFNGEVRGVDGLTLRLSQPVTLDTPADYSIVLTRSDGSVDSIGISAQPAPDRVTLSAAPSEAPYTGRDRDRTAYSLGTDDMRTKRAMLVREVITQRYNRITVRCVNYDDRYYQNDNV